jgi:hypothetical protein
VGDLPISAQNSQLKPKREDLTKHTGHRPAGNKQDGFQDRLTVI